MSASVLSHQRQRYADAGFDAVLDKPIDPERIVECLQRVAGVRFTDDGEPPAAELEHPISPPADLLRRLREATECYNITDLEELMGRKVGRRRPCCASTRRRLSSFESEM